jgi:2-polyprenyl-6-methoxyphenol hydroxylase-like FAD-dependent oxidoreductase
MTNMVANPQVLIVGAGPTGLMLALWLARRRIAVRIVDKSQAPGTTSRALVVHARTLEFYRQLGFADEAIARGIEFRALNLWARGWQVARVEIGAIGEGETPHPFMLILGQDRQEEILISQLAALGVAVERETELVLLSQDRDAVVATLKGPRGEERCECAWLAGCDGAHSTVREALGVGFPGGTYEHVYYVADIHGRGPALNGELNIALDENDFLAIFPMPGEGNGRLIGTVKSAAEGSAHPEWKDVNAKMIARMHVDVDRVHWFSTYHVHHRVVDHFRRGRVFLAGDAAHIHSPVGGQGMNTGLGDAVNLAWKLAMVIDGCAPDSLLDTYEAERIAFARRLVATTDRAFTFVTRNGPIARAVRLDLLPRLLPEVMHGEAARRRLFRTVSQIEIEYRDSALSRGHAGRVHGGDRLPWVPDNFAPLASLDWQAHIYGGAAERLQMIAQRLCVPVHVLPWSEEAKAAGLASEALYLVRPDGYVALADRHADALRLETYLGERGLRMKPCAGVPRAA